MADIPENEETADNARDNANNAENENNEEEQRKQAMIAAASMLGLVLLGGIIWYLFLKKAPTKTDGPPPGWSCPLNPDKYLKKEVEEVKPDHATLLWPGPCGCGNMEDCGL